MKSFFFQSTNFSLIHSVFANGLTVYPFYYAFFKKKSLWVYIRWARHISSIFHGSLSSIVHKKIFFSFSELIFNKHIAFVQYVHIYLNFYIHWKFQHALISLQLTEAVSCRTWKLESTSTLSTTCFSFDIEIWGPILTKVCCPESFLILSIQRLKDNV